MFLTPPGPFVELVSGAITEVTGLTPKLSTTGGTSDARFIKDYCPVIEFGLLSQQMHKIDEHVATADLVALTAIYRRILESSTFSSESSDARPWRARSSHFAISALTNAVNASGVFGSGSAPCSARRCLRLRRGEHRADIGADLRDDLARRAGRREQPEPAERLIAGKSGLGDGRKIRKQRRARGARHADHAQRAGRDVRRHHQRGENIASMRPPSRSVTAGPVPR